jgi:hypothetical protein
MPKTNASGQVAVFTQQGTTGHWTRTATVVASDRTEGDEFGRAVSYRDGLLIVGSNRAAYVYTNLRTSSAATAAAIGCGGRDWYLPIQLSTASMSLTSGLQ